MKIKELYESVAKLGFEDSLEDIPAFYYAANRAMLQVNALRPILSIGEIYHRACDNKALNAGHNIRYFTGEDVIIDASGPVKAYYFETLGTGEARIEIYNSVVGGWEIKDNITFSDNNEFTAHKGLIKPDGAFTDKAVRLRFIGEFAYRYRNVAFYDVVFSNDPEDVQPYTEYVTYDLKKVCDGFIELAEQPMKEGYLRLGPNYVLESPNVLLIKRECADDVKIKYKKEPKRLKYTDNPAKDETELELDPELSELVPLLVAAYIWADEGDGKYALYLELYRERAAEIERRSRSKEPAEYKLVGGW